jgi:hypothetical protein
LISEFLYGLLAALHKRVEGALWQTQSSLWSLRVVKRYRWYFIANPRVNVPDPGMPHEYWRIIAAFGIMFTAAR